MEWKNIYRGMAMGTSDVIPGVSGGTIAVLLGIYDQLVEAINGLFSKNWRKHLGFLVPLGVGMVIAIFTIAKLMKWLLKYYPGPTYFLFLGLIIASIPYLFQEANVKSNFKINQYILLIIGAILIGMLVLLHEKDTLITDRSLSTYLLLFGSGFIGSAAMILPGISGSFVLLVIGVYPTVIHAIDNFELDVIVVTGIGIAIGIISMSKIINYFLTHYRSSTFAIIIGMVIGSIVVILDKATNGPFLMVLSIITFAIGLLAAYILGKVEYEA